MKGIVQRSTGSWYEIRELNSQQIYSCRLVGKMKLDKHDLTNPIAVGDIVEVNTNTDSPVIETILPRKNYIIRKSLNLSKQAHILASNLDLAMLVCTMVAPRTSLGFIDRFLITAEAYQIPIVLVFNKTDLLEADLLAYQNQIIKIYTKIGYQCITTNFNDKESLIEIKKLLSNKTTLVAGHSGVGKTTLINRIEPSLNLKTGEISLAHLKGTHTTTFAELHNLSFGIYN